ncbi:MAG TPA: class I lanthipeptide [Thermoanaerobaculia bacterium]
MKNEAPTRKLRLRKEVLMDLTPKELANIAGGVCTCTTDFSNNCCGPNGSCKPGN